MFGSLYIDKKHAYNHVRMLQVMRKTRLLIEVSQLATDLRVCPWLDKAERIVHTEAYPNSVPSPAAH
jgi:hypothetical protein